MTKKGEWLTFPKIPECEYPYAVPYAFRTVVDPPEFGIEFRYLDGKKQALTRVSTPDDRFRIDVDTEMERVQRVGVIVEGSPDPTAVGELIAAIARAVLDLQTSGQLHEVLGIESAGVTGGFLERDWNRLAKLIPALG